MNQDALASPGGDDRTAVWVLPCADLDAAIAFYVGTLGFRLDMILPADAPRIARLSGYGIDVCLEQDAGWIPSGSATLRLTGRASDWQGIASHDLRSPDGQRVELIVGNSGEDFATPAITLAPVAFAIHRAARNDTGHEGRAGMHYRDLLPGRLDGRCIASQIRIETAGPVADYVHFHRVQYQLIYCLRGWVRLVYEDQGPPFLMQAGDCVLQPPTIRHRVLDASAGLEVIEIGAPAEHETWREHALELPTCSLQPKRLFGGQYFVHHVAANAIWQRGRVGTMDICATPMLTASQGRVGLNVLRGVDGQRATMPASQRGSMEFRLLLPLAGEVEVIRSDLGTQRLGAGDCCVIPPAQTVELRACGNVELLDFIAYRPD